MTGPSLTSTAPAGRVLAGAIAVFALLAALLGLGWLDALDAAAFLAIHGALPSETGSAAWISSAFRDWTSLGGRSVQALLFGLAAAWLSLVGRRREAAFLALAVVGGWLLGPMLKVLFDRPRPELATRLVEVRSASFPSAHATQAAAAWAAAALLLADRAGRAAAVLAFGVCGLIVGLVGASRVQLGVHHPSDVLAGWCVGLGWVAALRIALRRFSA